MTVTHVGSTKQYAEGWDGIFTDGAKRVTKRASGSTKSRTPRPAPRGAKKKATGKKK